MSKLNVARYKSKKNQKSRMKLLDELFCAFIM